MTRATLQRDAAWLRANPGLGVELFDILNHRPSSPNPPSPGVPHAPRMWWDPRRPGWRMTVTDPAGMDTPPRPGGVRHTPGGG